MKTDHIAKILFVFSVLGVVWSYGVLSHRYALFPYPQLTSVIKNSKVAVSSLLVRSKVERAWWYMESLSHVEEFKLHSADTVAPGSVLVSGISEDNELMAKIVDNQGKVIHQWAIDWFKLWPNPEHLNEKIRPKEKPGSHIQGIVFMPDGDLVFNFEHLGLMRLSFCGEVVWRLPYRTHHSVHLDESGNLWVGGQIDHDEPLTELPNHNAPFIEPTVLEVSSAGRILTEISVFDLLIENGLQGLLYMSTTNNWGTSVSGDTLHLNDVESFPSTFKNGEFERGDILISLRNINTILVFNKNTRKIKYINIGSFIRQHDPDFVDGNTISVFDNNNLSSPSTSSFAGETGLSSRIVVLNVLENRTSVFFEGSKDNPFFTNIMGKHQWLPNGNALISESRSGRAFEITSEGDVVWEYYNVVQEDVLGLIDEVQRLPPQFDPEFFARLNRSCNTV